MSYTQPSIFSSIRRRLGRVALHAGLTVLAAVNAVAPAKAQSEDYYAELFYQQGYGYCDARKLAKIYRTSDWQAKVIAGRKISFGNLNIVRKDWKKGVKFFRKHGFSCDQSSLSADERKFAYNDAETIARAWTGTKG
ncbi:MAG: hypothetical protein H6888_08655 [Nitratireductor sp.]|nr:hypothetical protein [Nitratireductor sp.]